MKAVDIALKDMLRSFRSFFAIVFMFIVPLLVTGMFYFMFGNLANNGGFNLPRTRVVIANMDEGGPKFQVNPKNIPGGKEATNRCVFFFPAAWLSVLLVLKASEGRPNVVDDIKNRSIDLIIINTPFGPAGPLDEFAIGWAPTKYRVSVITTLSAAEAIVRGLKMMRQQPMTYNCLQEYSRSIRKNIFWLTLCVWAHVRTPRNTKVFLGENIVRHDL